jgi:hypothetical protein
VIEVKSVTPDMQAMLSGIDRKTRLGPAIARERGWDPGAVARVLVVWDTTTNRRRLAAHAESVRTALPAGSREILAWLRDPVGPPVAGVWFLPNARGVSAMGVRRQRVRVARQGPEKVGRGPEHAGPAGPSEPPGEPPVRGRPATARTPRVP